LKLKDISKRIDATIKGDDSLEIDAISSLKEPKTNSLIYISNKKHITRNLLDSKSVFLIDESLIEEFKDRTLLISKNPQISFVKLLLLFKQKKTNLEQRQINDSNLIYIGDYVNIGTNFIYGTNNVIEANVTIGNNVTFGHNVVIHEGTTIGNNVTIESGSVIGCEGFGNFLSDSNEWLHIPHIGNVEIMDNVRIGANCCIDRGTIDKTLIHNGTIIDNLVHIAHNVTINENTAIAAKVGIAGSCNIGKRNMIGGMVGIVDHITTADDVIISATSTVSKNITEPGTYTGIMPISKHADWKRIAYWITKLDKITKLIKLKKK